MVIELDSGSVWTQVQREVFGTCVNIQVARIFSRENYLPWHIFTKFAVVAHALQKFVFIFVESTI
jgi:hypothetical protein